MATASAAAGAAPNLTSTPLGDGGGVREVGGGAVEPFAGDGAADDVRHIQPNNNQSSTFTHTLTRSLTHSRLSRPSTGFVNQRKRDRTKVG